MKSALEGEYGLFFGLGVSPAQALPTSVLPQRQGILECPLLCHPKAGIQPSLKELEVGIRAGGQADRRVPTALLLRSLPFRFLKNPVSVNSTIRRDLFVKESFQLCCLTGR